MKKLLVQLHLFYFEQTDYFIGKLLNICGCEWDLHVTVTRHDKISENKLLAAFPNAKITEVENRGADVWPFIQVIKSVDLNEYDFILKLHTKSCNPEGLKNNGILYKDYQWRDALVDAILKDKESFASALDKLCNSKNAGICYNVMFYKCVNKQMHEYLPLMAELERLQIKTRDLHYAAGTMFLAKAAPYRLLQTDKISSATFPDKFEAHSYGSMSHVYEFICSIVVTACGMKTLTLSKNIRQYIYIKWYICKIQPVLESIFSLKDLLGVKTLTLFGIRIPLKRKD